MLELREACRSAALLLKQERAFDGEGVYVYVCVCMCLSLSPPLSLSPSAFPSVSITQTNENFLSLIFFVSLFLSIMALLLMRYK